MSSALPVSLSTAMLRGVCCRCPHCGKGKLFVSFLKVVEQCSACGEELNHHKADDLPAYLVITIAGHILVPLIAIVEIEYSPSYWVHAVLWLPLCLIVCLGLLQPIKGAVVTVQWFNGMYGYLASKLRRSAVITPQE